LKTMRRAVACDNAPFMRTVRCLTVANTLSIGFVTGMKIGGAFLSGWDPDDSGVWYDHPG